MKKFIDFEIVLILTILILAGFALFAFKYGYVLKKEKVSELLITNKEFIVNLAPDEYKLSIDNFANDRIINSVKENKIIDASVIVISTYIFIIINIIYIGIKIIKCILKNREEAIYKNYLRDTKDYENIDVNTYDAVLASVLYNKKIDFNRLRIVLNSIFDEENNNEFQNVFYFEKEMQREFKNQKDLDENYAYKNIEKNIVIHLKKEGFVVFDKTVGIIIFNIINFLDEKYHKLPKKILEFMKFFESYKTDINHPKKAGIYIFLLMFLILFCISTVFFGIYITLATITIISILAIIFPNKILLTKKGTIERIKLIKLKKELENKREFTEREIAFRVI